MYLYNLSELHNFVILAPPPPFRLERERNDENSRLRLNRPLLADDDKNGVRTTIMRKDSYGKGEA